MDKRLEEIEQRSKESRSFGYGTMHYHEDVPYLLSIIRQQREALEVGLRVAKAALSDCGPCEHDVNICVCGLIHDVEIISSTLSLTAKTEEKP